MRYFFTATAVTLSGALMMINVVSTVHAAPRDSSAQSVIVVLKSDSDVEAVLSQLSAAYGFTPTQSYSHAIKGFAAQLTNEQRTKIAADPHVAFINNDYAVHTTFALR